MIGATWFALDVVSALVRIDRAHRGSMSRLPTLNIFLAMAVAIAPVY